MRPSLRSLVLLPVLLAGCRVAPGAADASAEEDGGSTSDSGSAGSCQLPAQLDFDVVIPGRQARRTLSLANFGTAELHLQLWPIIDSVSAPPPFRFEAPDLPGALVLERGQMRELVLTFSPGDTAEHLGLLKIQGDPECGERVLKLVGSGVGSVITWTPAALDFGYVTPGVGVSRELVFSNASQVPVTLTQLATSLADFHLASGTSLVVPPATVDANQQRTPGTAALSVRFLPTVFGPRAGALDFELPVAGQPSGQVALTGVGGGADIEVAAAPTLDVGRVASVAGTPLFTTRKLVVRNAGTKPSSPDDRLNLHLGSQGTAPYWSVTPSGANTGADELCVGEWDDNAGVCLGTLPPTRYDPVKGIPAEGPQARLEIPLRIAPKSLGLKQWTVVIYSDDLDEPEVTVTVRAEARNYPTCNFSVSATAMNFGLVTPPEQVTRDFTVTNLGTQSGEVCLISGLDLAIGSDFTFSLPDGPVFDRELLPGETLRVPVRARPTGAAPVALAAATGAVQMQLNNTATRQIEVALGAVLGESCLVISPSDLDFGTVQKDCNSATRTFSILNRCTNAVTLTGSEFVDAAGEPAFGPNCPGNTPCPEFTAVNTAGLAAGTQLSSSGAPTTFSLKYKPINLGADTGAFVLRALQNSVPVEEVVTLRGNGGTTGANSNLFQTGSSKVDALFIVDDSCSMQGKQAGLAANVPALLKYATQNAVDFQIGVTSTDQYDPARQGRIVGGILKSSQANLAATLAQRLKGGTSGAANEESVSVALAAVTNPLVDTANAGFVRPEADLAFVLLTDADDQSPHTVTYYVNQLLAVKGAQHPDRISYSGFIPMQPTMPTDCSYDSASAGTDPKHLQVITALGGVFSEICSSDWALAAETVGNRAFGKRPNYSLLAVPDGAQPITVKLDGADVPRVDGNGFAVWSYDVLINAVEFTLAFTPPAGKTLQVDYQVQCIP